MVSRQVAMAASSVVLKGVTPAILRWMVTRGMRVASASDLTVKPDVVSALVTVLATATVYAAGGLSIRITVVPIWAVVYSCRRPHPPERACQLLRVNRAVNWPSCATLSHMDSPLESARRFTEFVAIALEAERGAARLTVDELAARSGVPVRTLYRVLHAERSIDVAQLQMLANAFGVTPADIAMQAQSRMDRADRAAGGRRRDDPPSPPDPPGLSAMLGRVRGLPGISPKALKSLEDQIREDFYN